MTDTTASDRRRFLLAGLAAPVLLLASLPRRAPGQVAATRLRIAAGTENGNYTFAANEIAKRIDKTLFPGGVEVMLTKGSRETSTSWRPERPTWLSRSPTCAACGPARTVRKASASCC